MILGIDIPEGADISIDNGKIIIVFDENKTKTSFWKMSSTMWLTKGDNYNEFWNNETLSSKRLEVSHKDNIRLSPTK